ncbi:hypothetical protein MPSEU_000245100 [Mayamaea pseudoterrestris]|nr:hypothetical protein MPSEU_000245100 [Mayamaea pseudoterrestris]
MEIMAVSKRFPRQLLYRVYLILLLFSVRKVRAFVGQRSTLQRERIARSSSSSSPSSLLVRASFSDPNTRLSVSKKESIWEKIGEIFVKINYDASGNPSDAAAFQRYVQVVSTLRVGFPSLACATVAKMIYPSLSMAVASQIHDQGVFDVVANDYSQYIQNVLTTSGLVFSLLIGQTYYFMYQQQEAIYVALFEEVSMAKSLLEQIALVCQGRDALYQRILSCMNAYIRDDLVRFNEIDPAVMLSARPVDDPLEDILYLTSVGEPSIVYQTVRSLRSARAQRLGALQRKLPPIHRTLLWALAAIELCSFPLLGAGSQTIGGPEILIVQSWYLSFIVFGIFLVMGVIEELQMPGEVGAYNARTVLMVMVGGLKEELRQRMEGSLAPSLFEPSVDTYNMPVEADGNG